MVHEGKRWATLASYCQLKGTTTIHSHRFVMGLLQWHEVCKLGGDELHRPPVVALKSIGLKSSVIWWDYQISGGPADPVLFKLNVVLFSITAAACKIPPKANFTVAPTLDVYRDPDQPIYEPDFGKDLPYNYKFTASCNEPIIPVSLQKKLVPKCVFNIDTQQYKIDLEKAMECSNYGKCQGLTHYSKVTYSVDLLPCRFFPGKGGGSDIYTLSTHFSCILISPTHTNKWTFRRKHPFHTFYEMGRFNRPFCVYTLPYNFAFTNTPFHT